MSEYASLTDDKFDIASVTIQERPDIRGYVRADLDEVQMQQFKDRYEQVKSRLEREGLPLENFKREGTYIDVADSIHETLAHFKNKATDETIQMSGNQVNSTNVGQQSNFQEGQNQ